MYTMLCLKCAVEINGEADRFIRCDGCNKPFHHGCSELSVAELKCFDLRPNAKRRVKFLCYNCDKYLDEIPKLIASINEMKEDIKTLKESTTLTSNPSDPVKLPAMLDSEEGISEINERNKRASNLIIYGSVESGKSKNEQIEHDASLVTDILSQIGLTEGSLAPQRIGKFDPSKQMRRPIKIRLSSPQSVHAVFRKFKNIKSETNFPTLSVSSDRTPRQIAYYKVIKQELDNRIRQGEMNIKIKYRNGVPTIISSEN